MNDSPAPQVGLFATCLVDLMRPSVGFAAARLLDHAGCDVHVPELQTCCGQPAYNSGAIRDSRALATNVIEQFENFDYVVAPSGSCAGMIKEHYPALFKDDAAMLPRAEKLAAKTHELLSFLVDVIGVEDFDAAFDARVTYHDSCAGLREMGVLGQPRALMNNVDGLALAEIEGVQEKDACCGFGGLFSVKYPDISTRIVDAKVEAIEKTGADVLLGGDLGCLMNIAGRLQRCGSKVTARHLAEVLAGTHEDTPPIGEKG